MLVAISLTSLSNAAEPTPSKSPQNANLTAQTKRSYRSFGGSVRSIRTKPSTKSIPFALGCHRLQRCRRAQLDAWSAQSAREAAAQVDKFAKGAKAEKAEEDQVGSNFHLCLKRLFEPTVVEVRLGEQVRFEIVNSGSWSHEFVLATEAANRKHAELMKKFPDMEHADSNALRLSPFASGAILWKFTRRGKFEYACLIPGHREAGMHGEVIVK
jgi:uncharacterized cupredoxin-like copper-binding protein